MKRGKNMLNAKLECHIVGPHVFLHKVFGFILMIDVSYCGAMIFLWSVGADSN